MNTRGKAECPFHSAGVLAVCSPTYALLDLTSMTRWPQASRAAHRHVGGRDQCDVALRGTG